MDDPRWQPDDPRWQPPARWRRITTIEAHTAGEPFRVIVDGFPEPRGATMLERRRDARDRLDPLRRALIHEPRGHADMYAGLPTPPVTPGADLGVLFLHNEGWSTMCGHGIIALSTVVLETGMRPATEPETTLRVDTPAGPVVARARVDDGGRVERVRFTNVPSFVVELDAAVAVPGYGEVRYDLAFGGAFYAYVDAASVGLELEPARVGELIAAARAIKAAVVDARTIEHPLERDLGFLYGVIFVGPARDPACHSRNVCVFADGEVDRSPTGTGVSGRLAIHHARGELARGQEIVVESILGTRFAGRVLDVARVGRYDAIVPEVAGRAFLVGRSEFWLDPDDPLRDGFLLR